MPKDIFKAIDPSFIIPYLTKKKNSFFPEDRKKKIAQIEIKQISPLWAKDTCLAKYKIDFKDGSQKIIRGTAKINTSKIGVWNIMNYLYKNKDNSRKMAIPRPLEYLEKINLLLYEEAPGTPLVFLLQEKNIREKKKAIKMAAVWLSWLHGLSPKKVKISPAVFIGSVGYKKTLIKIKNNIPELKNYFSVKKGIGFKDIELINDIWVVGNTIIHNDFYPGNMIIGDEFFFGIDFDKSGFGPPLMDIAALFSFFDFSKRMWPYKMPKKESQLLKETFLKEYCLNNNLDLEKTIADIYPFLIKSFFDRLHGFVVFFMRGRKFMDQKTKNAFLLIIKDILDEIKKLTKR